MVIPFKVITALCEKNSGFLIQIYLQIIPPKKEVLYSHSLAIKFFLYFTFYFLYFIYLAK